MEENMQTEETPKVDVKALLAVAAQVPKGKRLKKYDPMESIPTLGFGRDIEKGQIVAGTYLRTETIASHKFTYSQEKNEAGVPTQDRHILKLSDGTLMGLWTTGPLSAAFGKLPAGTFITLKYNGKGKNNKGQQEHFFDYEIEESSTLQ